MAEVRERSLIDRMIGVAKLDAATFEEIEHDESATMPALIIAALAGLSVGLGATFLGAALGEPVNLGTLVLFAATYTIVGVIALALFTIAAYFVGGQLLRSETTEITWTELFRTLGFAGVPLMIAGWISLLNLLLMFALTGWFLAAVVIALRQAIDINTGRAVVTALAGLTLLAIISIALFLNVNPA